MAVLFSIGLIGISPAQDYQSGLTDSDHRPQRSFGEDPRSPITKKRFKASSLLCPDGKYSLEAEFWKEFAQKGYRNHSTSSGKQKLFIRFGRLNFKLDGQVIRIPTSYLMVPRTGARINRFLYPFMIDEMERRLVVAEDLWISISFLAGGWKIPTGL
ncbi:MAG: hypothetical protein IPN13_12685 [Bacteroidetes bacterium]|nr:hypothetical protein [Bacteroidota bacterium]